MPSLYDLGMDQLGFLTEGIYAGYPVIREPEPTSEWNVRVIDEQGGARDRYRHTSSVGVLILKER